MNLIVSATTAGSAVSAARGVSSIAKRRSSSRQGVGAGGVPLMMLEKIRHAERALVDSERHLAQGDLVLALEYAYRASIRLASARIADSQVAKKARKPKDVWGQLRMVDSCAARWANAFRQFSNIRSRAMSGLRQDVTINMVSALHDLNRQYIALLLVGDYGTGPGAEPVVTEGHAA